MKDLQVHMLLPGLTVSPGPHPYANRGCVPSQAKYDALKKQMESMEMEVMEARLIRAAELNGELDDDDSGTVLPPALTAGTPWVPCGHGTMPLSPRWPPTTPHSPSVTPFPRAGGEWRLKYERAVREIDFTKKRLQQELEDKLEVEQQSKRQLERRVSRGLWGPLGPPVVGMGSCCLLEATHGEHVAGAAGTWWLPGALTALPAPARS